MAEIRAYKSGEFTAASITGQTEDTLPDMVADYLIEYDASANALKKTRFRNVVNKKIQSQVTGYAASVADGLAVCSGASFTITLPDAASIAGTVLEFLHNGTSLSQVYTLDGDGADTIGGSATYGLYTAGEFLSIMSDGTNWLVLEHETRTGVINAGTLTIDAVTLAPTKGTTSVDLVTWERRGKSALITYRYHQSAAGSGATGTGEYLISLPANMTMDNTNDAVSTAATTSLTAGLVLGIVPGSFRFSGTAGTGTGSALMYTSTQFRVSIFRYDANSLPTWSATFGALNGAVVTMYGSIEIPISGWQP